MSEWNVSGKWNVIHWKSYFTLQIRATAREEFQKLSSNGSQRWLDHKSCGGYPDKSWTADGECYMDCLTYGKNIKHTLKNKGIFHDLFKTWWLLHFINVWHRSTICYMYMNELDWMWQMLWTSPTILNLVKADVGILDTPWMRTNKLRLLGWNNKYISTS